MRRLLFLILISVFTLAIAFISITAKEPGKNDMGGGGLHKASGLPIATLVNVNNMSMWIRADGFSSRNPFTGGSGVIYPRGTAGVIFADGILWGGLVKDGQSPELRVGGNTYNQGTVEGAIISKGVQENPNNADVRIWRIREDWQTADLKQDAAEIFDIPISSVTDGQIATVRAQYGTDWDEWPWQKGAPFYDDNDDGVYDPVNDRPGIADADQVVWFVRNDLSSGATTSFLGSPPIGLEIQETLWGYSSIDSLANMIFKKVALIYKGTSITPDTATIEELFLTQWSDPDLGSFGDDFVGWDADLQMGFVYNSNNTDVVFTALGLVAPAIGYSMLQGPIFGGDTLEISSFVFFAAGSSISDPPLGSYEGTIQWFNLMHGLQPATGNPFVDPNTGIETVFTLSGDPKTGEGWVDGNPLGPGDRRFLLTSGPFSMALGDTQEIIYMIAGATGDDYLDSITELRKTVGSVIEKKSFPNYSVINADDSGLGSLRQAILDANTHAGKDTIRFFIPGEGPHTIQPNSTLPAITGPIVIDGYSQSGASPNTNPIDSISNAVLMIEIDGSNSPNSFGLRIEGGNSIIRGLAINRFSPANPEDPPEECGGIVMDWPGESNLIEGNYIGTDITGTAKFVEQNCFGIVVHTNSNKIGGTDPAMRNVISGNVEGIVVDGMNNVIEGNYIGTDVGGTVSLGNTNLGINLFGRNNRVGGTATESRNIISGNDLGIIMSNGVDAILNTIIGNYIGTDVTGTQAIGNLIGVWIDESQNIIGGSTEGAGNLISGNIENGIQIGGDEFEGKTPVLRNVVIGNLIGTDITGTAPLGNGRNGILIVNSSDNIIGGGVDEANVIAFNTWNGVQVESGTGNEIISNSIFGNTLLGIDLGNNGSTPNDPGDADEGANNIQNFPAIINASVDQSEDWLIEYYVDSDPTNSVYPLLIQFFIADLSGEGKTFLMEDTFTTVDHGNEIKTVNLGQEFVVENSQNVSIAITATDSEGNTSEFTSNDFIIGINDEDEVLPEKFSLYNAYPNPFNPQTTISYGLPKQSDLSLIIYNIMGQEIMRWDKQNSQAGFYQKIWNGRNKFGVPVGSGVYFYRIIAGDFVQTKKMLLLK